MRMRTIKPWWVIAAFLSGLAFAMFAEDLILSTHESRLEFAAPRVHFLVGKPLERLRNASEVPFDFKIILWSGTRSHIAPRSSRPFRGELRSVGGERFR